MAGRGKARVRRVLRLMALAMVGLLVLLGAQVILALRRDYNLRGPEQPIRGQYGDPSSPGLSFVVLGDSTSVGVGTTPDNSYPVLLAKWLGRSYRVRLEVVGAGGATTRDVADRQVKQALALNPDLVLVEIGANDTTHVTPLGVVRAEMAQALDALRAGGPTVVVAGPPHMGTSPAIARPLRTVTGWRGAAVRRTIESEVRKRGLPYIDLSAGTYRQFSRDAPRYYSADWFHPGTAGYKLWAEVMYPTVLEAARIATT